MSFTEAIKVCFSKYVVFSGRASRAEYWWFFLFNFIAAFVVALISRPLSIIYYLAVLLPSLAVGIRRLHDTNRSGWWLLISLIPLLGGIILIVFFALEGSEGVNDYGEEPRHSNIEA